MTYPEIRPLMFHVGDAGDLRHDDACQDTILDPGHDLPGFEASSCPYRAGQIWANRRNKPESVFIIHRLVERFYPKTGDLRLRVLGLIVDEDGCETRSLDASSLSLMFPALKFDPPPHDTDEEDK